MANYFRITAYHPDKDISAILDSYGKFEKLWQFITWCKKALRLYKYARAIIS